MRNLKVAVDCYWYLRQIRNRIAKDLKGRMGPFWLEWLDTRIHAIGKAIMSVRAKEI